MEANDTKQLRIRTGCVKRTYKEYLSYQKEAEKEEQKVKKMEEDKKDEAEIKHQKQVLEETLMMIPNTKTRLEGAVADLTELVEAVAEGSSVKESPEYKAAQEMLTEVNNFLKPS
eukprot:TRINITY_DN2315_c0_g3_i4.p2 TRINITY_DN2315_c0_g3~~TRINITY_DN2315_c0_g3_i4.p2  ORF type:complete len:115 (-),score=52.02 TRINITY_DN2315_c0_g3_i4:117-461(-)